MGFLSRFRPGGDPRRERDDRLHIGDPRFDDWEVVRGFDDLASAQAWRQQLIEADIDAVITADSELDRFGRGDIYLQVPPDRWSDAEELLSNIDLD